MRISLGKLLTGAFSVISFFSSQAAPNQAAQATNALAVQLLQDAPSGNAAFSPYSIQMALAMLYAGAEGETRTQMAAALKYPQADMVPLFGALQKGIQPIEGEAELLSANRLFGQSGYPIRPEYLNVLQQTFGSELEQLDFAKPAGAAKKINDWVEESTHKRIQNLVSPEALADARLVLANAIYFKAAWAEEFSKESVRPLTFHLSDGKEVRVPTMNATEQYGWGRSSNFQIISLPYRDRDFQLVIFLPDKELKLSSLAEKLDASLWQKCTRLDARLVDLYLPKFKLTPAGWNLSNVLQKLGMPSAFDQPPGSANFNGLAKKSASDYLYVSQVIHKCFVEVDEAGTEAAAATAVMVALAAVPAPRSQPIEVRVDRPFLFAIQHCPTGAILFLGRVENPGDN